MDDEGPPLSSPLPLSQPAVQTPIDNPDAPPSPESTGADEGTPASDSVCARALIANPPFLHPATNKSGERRAKSYLGAWGGNIFSECHFLNQLAPPKSNSKSLSPTSPSQP